MTKQDFLILMRILKAYYLTWSFDTGNKVIVETWYQYLQDLGFKRLKRVIHFYMTKYDHGPESPRDIMRAHFELELQDMIHNGEEEPDNE